MNRQTKELDYSQTTKQQFSEKWTSALVDQHLSMLDEGIKTKNNPFYDGNINYRKGALLFEYTQEELKEIYKCATDVVYFANKYACVMTDEGVQPITLRDYQVPILKDFTDPKKRYNILLASRL